MNEYSSIRSFVHRARPYTQQQKELLSKYWPRYGIEAAQLRRLNLEKLTLEIGFGQGENLSQLITQYPERTFLGVEVYRPGIIALLRHLTTQQPMPNNYYLANQDANLILQNLPNASLEACLILFPDPWPKSRHRKRRLIQPAFLSILAEKIQPQGILRIKTDHSDYAQAIECALAISPFKKVLKDNWLSHLLPSKFELKGIAKNHSIFDFNLYKAA